MCLAQVPGAGRAFRPSAAAAAAPLAAIRAETGVADAVVSATATDIASILVIQQGRFSNLPCFLRLCASAAGWQNSWMPKFTHHIFICVNRRDSDSSRGCCDPEGDEALKSAFKKELKRRDLRSEVRANTAGCLDQCELGPTIVIYPQAIWYGGVKLKDVPRIVEETIVHGRVLEDLLIPDEKLNCRKK